MIAALLRLALALSLLFVTATAAIAAEPSAGRITAENFAARRVGGPDADAGIGDYFLSNGVLCAGIARLFAAPPPITETFPAASDPTPISRSAAPGLSILTARAYPPPIGVKTAPETEIRPGFCPNNKKAPPARAKKPAARTNLSGSILCPVDFIDRMQHSKNAPFFQTGHPGIASFVAGVAVPGLTILLV